MARRSQVTSAMLGVISLASLASPACLIPEAPEYTAARETPVFIVESSISPNPRSMLHIVNAVGNQVQFQFNVHSEDAGQELVAALFLDYKHDTGLYLVDYRYKPLTFDEDRPISVFVTFPDGRIGDAVTPACHSFTLMVLHADGWDDRHKAPLGNPPDLASVTWFASFNDNGSGTLSSCPNADTEMSAPDGNQL